MSTWSAKEIQYVQQQYGQTGKTVERITSEIYEHVKSNPDAQSYIFQHSFDESVKDRLKYLEYEVEEVFGGVYKDQIWTKVSW